MILINTRRWNLVPSTLLLASACQSLDIPIDQTETGDTVGDGDGDGDPTGDGDGDGDGDPSGDGDGDGGEDDDGYECVPECDPDEYCMEGHCIEIFEPDCYADSECLPGEICDMVGSNDAACALVDPLAACAGPAFVEIPLPNAAQGETLDLEFVDLDSDGIDELLLLQPGALVVVTSDQTVTSSAVDPLSTNFVVVRADEDEDLDVFLNSDTPDHSGLLLGNGDGSFGLASLVAVPPLLELRAVDWPTGDSQELVGIGDDTMLVSQIANDPMIVGFDNLGTPQGLHATDIDDDGEDEVLLRFDCHVYYQGMAGTLNSVGGLNAQTPCVSYAEPFGAEPRLVILNAIDAFQGETGLQMYWGFGLEPVAARFSGEVSDLVGVPGLGFVVAGPTGTRLIVDDNGAIECVADLADLPTAERVIAGEFGENPGEELVLLSGDELTLWGQP